MARFNLINTKLPRKQHWGSVVEEQMGNLFVKVELQMKLTHCLISPKDLSLQMLRPWCSNTELKVRVEGSNKSQEQMPRHCNCLTFFNILWLVLFCCLTHPCIYSPPPQGILWGSMLNHLTSCFSRREASGHKEASCVSLCFPSFVQSPWEGLLMAAAAAPL